MNKLTTVQLITDFFTCNKPVCASPSVVLSVFREEDKQLLWLTVRRWNIKQLQTDRRTIPDRRAERWSDAVTLDYKAPRGRDATSHQRRAAGQETCFWSAGASLLELIWHQETSTTKHTPSQHRRILGNHTRKQWTENTCRYISTIYTFNERRELKNRKRAQMWFYFIGSSELITE